MRLFSCSRRLRVKVNKLSLAVEQLNGRVDELERDLVSGIFSNAPLRQFLKGKVGQTILVSTASATVEGILITAGTDALELRETSGGRLLIPYSRITILQ